MTSSLKQQTASNKNQDAPSFLNRLLDFVKQLPIPYWQTYLALIFIQSTIVHILAWIDRWIPAFTLHPMLFIYPIWQWLTLAIMTYVDSVSLQALAVFSSLLDIEEIELQKLKVQFARMPSRGVILSGAAWAAVYFILNIINYNTLVKSFGFDNFLFGVLFLEGLISFLTGGAIYYHSLRLLSLINHTVRLAKRFNMFRLDPVYAFSRATSLIGVSWMLMLSLTLLLFPIQLVGGLILAMLVFQVLLAVGAFVLPLWFVHRRLVAEKLKLLADFNRQVESTSAKLHHCLDQNEIGQVTQLKDAMLGLTAEHEILIKMPTWPWRSGTLTGFLSAAVLPLVLFLIQFAIQKLVGK